MKKTLKAVEAKEEQLLETVERPFRWAREHWLPISVVCLAVFGSLGLWRYSVYTRAAQLDDGWQRLEDLKVEQAQDRALLATKLGEMVRGDLAPSVRPWVELEHALALLDAGEEEEGATAMRALAGRTELSGHPAVTMAKRRAAVIDENTQWGAEHSTASQAIEVKGENPTVNFVTSKGEVVVELFEDYTPNSTANLISLVEQGWYDGCVIHRVDPVERGGVVQFGRRFNIAEGTRSPEEGPGYQIRAEIHDDLHHEIGTLAMARERDYDSAGSQLFFNTRDNRASYDGRYTVIGKVTEGLPNLLLMVANSDMILKAEVLTKRDHEYAVEKLPRD